MAISGEEAAAMTPEQRPDLFKVSPGQVQSCEGFARKKPENPLAMRHRSHLQPRLHLKQKHEPMALAFVSVFGDDSGEMQIGRLELQPHFLRRFATGAGIRRFADVHVQLSATGTPHAQVWLLGPFHQQHFVPLIKAIEQGGDLELLTNTRFHGKNIIIRVKTYLYNRISSGRQNTGDGLLRQLESTEVFDFLKHHKLEIVERMVYTGSSFTGKNFDNETVLGKFIEDVNNGKIPAPVCLCFETYETIVLTERLQFVIIYKSSWRFYRAVPFGQSEHAAFHDLLLPDTIKILGGADEQLAIRNRDGGMVVLLINAIRGEYFEFISGIEHHRRAAHADAIDFTVGSRG